MADKTENSELDQKDRIAKIRDKVATRMLNSPPKEHPKPKPGGKPGRPVKGAPSSSASEPSD